ncbi:MAG: cytochrome P450, partial [Desulfocurvibacter africanus]
MPTIPSDKLPESTLALFRDGYEFIGKRCERLGSDVFQTRLMLQKTVCMRGPEAAKVFYDRRFFQRQGGAPLRLQKTLFGRGGVQGMDGEAHRHRKAMFMSLMTQESIDRLVRLMSDKWRAAILKWAEKGRIVLLDAAREVLCRAVCVWADIPLKEAEVRKRTRDFADMIDDSGGVGPRYWRGRLARMRAEKWIGGIIEAVRANELNAAKGSALRTIAFHRGLGGELLDTHTASVELINILRPTVAVARFITFAALAMYEYPDWRRRLARQKDRELELFVQEVRRFYPFFPFVAARVSKPFDWRGYHFPVGARALLDLYGTDHDPRVWEDPETFRPQRFLAWDGSPFNFISQGGGDHYESHR